MSDENRFVHRRFPDPVEITELRDQILGYLNRGLSPEDIAYILEWPVEKVLRRLDRYGL